MSIIALTGKGGVGKTTLSALMIRWLIANGKQPVLAVDADSNTNLHELLGIEFTSTVGGIREQARKIVKSDPSFSKQEYLQMQINQALVENKGFDFLAMGRPEGPGCYCYANNVLRDTIAEVASGYKHCIIDCEAGLEHISRRTVLNIDHLITVSDPSIRGLHTAARISELLEEMKTRVRHRSLIVNKVPDISRPLGPEQQAAIASSGFEKVYLLPADMEVSNMDSQGGTVMDIPESASVYKSIDEIMGIVDRSI